jgi:DNA topoisomerase-1
MDLVIVESPTKARKLKGYLGGDFQIEASVGHIRDLPKSGLGVDVDNDFDPVYEVNEDKEDVVKKLVKLAKKADHIILATDPDREGEAIAWHLKFLITDALKNDPDFKRATFHEITKSAVQKAIEKPGKLNQDLVDAQQARRIVDRLVGYKVSPVLWKKIRRGLSAGRVQSVALRLIVEREKEIQAFVPDEYWELDTLFSLSGGQEKAANLVIRAKKKDEDEEVEQEKQAWEDLVPENHFVGRVFKVNKKKFEPTKQEEAQPVLDVLAAADTEHKIDNIERKQRRRASLAPFSTSTLQQQAATRLSMTSKQTMRLAQQLYEEGLITYHRTDSFNLSTQALDMARGHIKTVYGDKYLPEKPRVFASKSKNAQEAHEAIRVTDINVTGTDVLKAGKKMTNRHQQLYDLIWKRFVASQMEKAVYDQTTFFVESTNAAHSKTAVTSKATGSVLRFDGWMKLFPGSGDTILPEVAEGQPVAAEEVLGVQKFTQPPARYNDASLVKELEKKGIGRPSTYASIISVIESRGYVVRDNRRFVASPVGITVVDFLKKHFDTIMDYDFTAEMEEDLDRISRGEKEWKSILREFYKPFAAKIEKVEEKAERAKVPVEKTGEKCPTCQEQVDAGELPAADQGEIVIRSGRFGKFKSCSRFPDCKFTENIVEKLGDQKCPVCDEGDIIIRKSRWGKPFYGCSRYPDCDWASWGKPEPGLKISKAEWKKMQEERKARMEKRKKAKAAKSGTKKKTTKKKSTKKTAKKKTTKKAASKKAK